MTKYSLLHLATIIFLVIAPNLHRVAAQSGNTRYGSYALNTNGGKQNSAFGYGALRYNIDGFNNTACGYVALGSNTTGYYNTATGFFALFRNKSGNYNTAVGVQALNDNISGGSNTAIGGSALASNTSGGANTASGLASLFKNTTGYNNTASGFKALYSNTTGYNNTTSGYNTLYFNTTGKSNTASGYYALYSNTTGSYNTASGLFASRYNTSGSFNTAVGTSAGASAGNFNNTTALGYYAIATASNQVRIGNSAVTSIGGITNWTKLSDGRFKLNIQQDVPGLEFITQLRPVTYTVDVMSLNKALWGSATPLEVEEITAKSASVQIKHTGFIAQEVEQVAARLHFEFSGVDKPQNDKDFFGLRYAEFVVPLVKAVQELSKKDEELTKKTEEIEQLKKELVELRQMVLELKQGSSGSNLSAAYLEQSTPNPSSGTALIRYYVPHNSGTAHLVFTDIKGAIIKSIPVSSKGSGQLTVYVTAWTAGTYTYTLYINGTQADSRKLVIAR
jgi:trimeric autotransporter adhesin